MSQTPAKLTTEPRWGQPPWTIDFHPQAHPLPAAVDFAIVGGGFSGLSTAAWLRRFDPTKSVVLLEAGSIGAGSSGRTGGTALAESSAGDLPGLGDVLAGYSQILRELDISADLHLPGAWELSHLDGLPNSPISWHDSGILRAAKEVPGGSVDPGKVVSGLARAAERAGAIILENSRVEDVAFPPANGGAPADNDPLRLDIPGQGTLRAKQVLFASNAESLELSGLAGHSDPKLTLALATEPLTAAQLEAIGLASGKVFYTIDFPYLWGRLLPNSGVIFGSGLVEVDNWRGLAALDIATGESARLLARLENRVRGLHPALQNITVTHRWGGPMLIGENWTPAFKRHPLSPRAIILGAYSGHGVALSVYLGRWAAEAMLDKRPLPDWD
jgi:glycine/D-amino acid oxidase-like deaminating enzyme